MFGRQYALREVSAKLAAMCPGASKFMSIHKPTVNAAMDESTVANAAFPCIVAAAYPQTVQTDDSLLCHLIPSPLSPFSIRSHRLVNRLLGFVPYRPPS